MSHTNRNHSNQKTGAHGEKLATRWFSSGGYEIVERNWRQGRYEIDIIAQINGILHFVEVKTVTTDLYGFAEEKINKEKLKNMRLAAKNYLRTTHWNGAVQFDVFAIRLGFEPFEYCFLEDVWP